MHYECVGEDVGHNRKSPRNGIKSDSRGEPCGYNEHGVIHSGIFLGKMCQTNIFFFSSNSTEQSLSRSLSSVLMFFLVFIILVVYLR